MDNKIYFILLIIKNAGTKTPHTSKVVSMLRPHYLLETYFVVLKQHTFQLQTMLDEILRM